MTLPIRTYPLPNLIAHSDWGSNPRKRWMAQACLSNDGRYLAHAPEPVGEAQDLLQRLRETASPQGAVLAGFDFPIGLPARYAERAGIQDFLALLPQLGQGAWADFYDVAETPDQVSLQRPFYPNHPGQAKQSHLLHGLGVDAMDDLRRLCERARPGRRAASPLFWTLGGQQVGKAAIHGWREVLGPALRGGAGSISPQTLLIWPFSGRLYELFKPGAVVVAETYPAEFYTHLGVTFSLHRAGARSGKRVRSERLANAVALFAWAERAGVDLDPGLEAAIRDGFGMAPDSDDPFDAAVGLLGMLNVVLGHRPAGEPQDKLIRRVEGWILGQ